MNDLVSTGAEGVDMLVSMFDDTNNVPVSYALSGWSAFVSGPDREQARKEFVDGIIRGLKKSNNAEIKAFYIRLLQQCGKKESVDVLAGLIGDQRLGGPALTALVSNGTPEAETAIAQGDRLPGQAIKQRWLAGRRRGHRQRRRRNGSDRLGRQR